MHVLALALMLSVSAEKNAADQAEDAHAAALIKQSRVTFNEMTGYGRFLSSAASPGNPMSGGALGFLMRFDWGVNEHGDSDFRVSVLSEVALGGAVYGTAQGGGGFAFDLIGDVLGVTLQGEVGPLGWGLFYEPLELYFLAPGFFLGSKLEGDLAWHQFQLKVARGGGNFVYGFVVPSPLMPTVHSVELEYRAGLKYSLEYQNALSPGSNGQAATMGHSFRVGVGGWW